MAAGSGLTSEPGAGRPAAPTWFIRFTHAAEADRVVTLEGVGEGSLATGRPVRYAGVSILECADDKISEFRTYYDSAAFISEDPEHTHLS